MNTKKDNKEYVYSFMRHCLSDDEALAWGIPTKESYYLKKLGWDNDSDETEAFYTALYILLRLRQGKKIKVTRMFNGYGYDKVEYIDV